METRSVDQLVVLSLLLILGQKDVTAQIPRYVTPPSAFFTTPRFTTPLYTTPKATSTTTATTRSCACQKLEVTGSLKYQAASTGFYTLVKCSYNDKPVYKHDDRGLYIYFSKSNYWAVGLAPESKVLLRVGDLAPSPANVTADWEELDGFSTVIYKTVPTFKVACACTAFSCERLSVRSSSSRASLGGHFVRRRELLNGRPTFANDAEGLYLYLKKTPSCAYWAVGPTLNGDNAIMVANDDALNPEDVSARWNLHFKKDNKMEWSRKYDVSLTCLTSSL